VVPAVHVNAYEAWDTMYGLEITRMNHSIYEISL